MSYHFQCFRWSQGLRNRWIFNLSLTSLLAASLVTLVCSCPYCPLPFREMERAITLLSRQISRDSGSTSEMRLDEGLGLRRPVVEDEMCLILIFNRNGLFEDELNLTSIGLDKCNVRSKYLNMKGAVIKRWGWAEHWACNNIWDSRNCSLQQKLILRRHLICWKSVNVLIYF